MSVLVIKLSTIKKPTTIPAVGSHHTSHLGVKQAMQAKHNKAAINLQFLHSQYLPALHAVGY